MTTEQLERLAEMLAGLKKYEWLKIAHAVDKKFSSMESKLELPSQDEILKAIRLEW